MVLISIFILSGLSTSSTTKNGIQQLTLLIMIHHPLSTTIEDMKRSLATSTLPTELTFTDTETGHLLTTNMRNTIGTTTLMWSPRTVTLPSKPTMTTHLLIPCTAIATMAPISTSTQNGTFTTTMLSITSQQTAAKTYLKERPQLIELATMTCIALSTHKTAHIL